MQLQIADDGVGFPEGFDEWRDAGIGLRLVRTLVESAGGWRRDQIGSARPHLRDHAAGAAAVARFI